MNNVFSDKKAILIFTLPALLLFLGFVAIPLAMSSYYSFLKWDGMGDGIFIGFQNYLKLFIDNTDSFLSSVWHSAVNALMAIFIQLPVALFFALVLARGIKGEAFFRSVFFIPVTISGNAIAQLWLKIYNPQYGALNAFLNSVGLGSLATSWLGDARTALIAVFVPGVWQYIGYHMLIMYAAAKSIPDEINEAAIIDGSKGFTTAFRITIPLILPTIRICIIFALIGSLKIFDAVFVLTGGGPARATEVTSTLMFDTIFRKYQYGYGSSMAMFIVIECLLLTILVRKLLKTEDISF